MAEFVASETFETSERNIYLTSNEGEKFSIPLETALISKLIETMFDSELPEDEEQEFPLISVSTEILSKVVEFLIHYKKEPMTEIEKPLNSSNMNEAVQKWYVNFVNVEHDTLFDLVLAANYMDIQPLLDLTCATIASMIKGKTPEEINKHFNIVNDFILTDDEKKIREENKWCEEI